MSPSEVRALAALLALTPVACSVHHVGDPPAPPLAAPVPARFTEASEAAASEAPIERWWTQLEDPELDRLVAQALADNLDLRRAAARVAQAEAVARAADSGLLPRLNAQAGVSGARTVFNLGEPLGVRSTESASYTVSLSAAYEIDLWGRIGHAADAAARDVLASREDMSAAALSLSARVTDLWLQRTGERALLALIARQEDAAQKLVALVELRFAQGLAASQDVYQQRQSLAAVRAARPLALGRVAVVEHQLAILLGRPPGALTLADRDALPALPPSPPTGVPTDLLMRRPDVRAALQRITAADHRVGQAIAAQYPSLSLSASTGFQAPDLLALFEHWIWNLAANLLAPLFDGGQRSAEVDRARGALEELVTAYGQITLTALGEVEDALVQERRQADNVVDVEAQLALATLAHDEARVRYANGLATYLDVLTTERTLQQVEQALLQARRQLLTYRVQLHRALGGSWMALGARTPEPSPREEDTP